MADKPKRRIIVDLGTLSRRDDGTIEQQGAAVELIAGETAPPLDLLQYLLSLVKLPRKGRSGPSPTTLAGAAAMTRWIYDHGLDKQLSAEKLVIAARDYAIELDLPEADQIDPANSSLRVLAGEILRVMRLPDPK